MNTDKTIQINPQRVSRHNLTLSRINVIKDHSSTLTVNGVKDHAGLRKVVKTRKFIKRIRLNVEARRREINADMLREIRENNFAARFIINELKPSEKYLNNIEKEIANEKEAIKLEKKRLELERLQKRIDALAGFDVAVNIADIKDISDQEFSILLEKSKIDYLERQAQKEADAKRLAEENNRLKEENKKLKESVEQSAANTVDVASSFNEVIPEPTTSITDTPQPQIYDEDLAEIKLLVKNYASALQAVPVPYFKNEQARSVMLNAQTHINTGIKMLLNAVD